MCWGFLTCRTSHQSEILHSLIFTQLTRKQSDFFNLNEQRLNSSFHLSSRNGFLYVCSYFYFCLSNSELFKEFQELAEDLKPYTAQVMKIEVAPWIRDYVVDMNELYCELEIERIHYKIHGEETKLIDDYRMVFSHDTDKGQDTSGNKLCFRSKIPVRQKSLTLKSAIQPANSKRNIKTFKKEDKKSKIGLNILFKGDPGIGKTTLLKKMGWDWAKCLFARFTVVFVVLLKLVRPKETIENAIIHQTPILEGLEVTQQKLSRFLNKFGSKCLLVLDGLDEHVAGENTDVHRIIKRKKYLSCSVVVSSRPHSVRNLENYFDTIVRVNGFTLKEAEEFAMKILHNESKVRQVLRFNPLKVVQRRHKGGRRRKQKELMLCNYPILLSFLCLLVREEEVDFSSKALPVGEIYTRMVRCLYKKYVIRKKISFSDDQFVSVLKRVGKLALRTLLSGNPLLRRSEVEEEIGPEAFDYGLLIGHEDALHTLLRDETADISVTFPHRSIQEFLGAFYFILMLNDGVSVELLLGTDCKDPIFLMNPLFLHFCLWLLYVGDKYFAALQSGLACESLEKYCAHKISRLDLLLPEIARTYPALDIEKFVPSTDDTMLRFFKRTLLQMKNVKSFAVDSERSFNAILPLLGPLTETIVYVHVDDTTVTCCNNQLIINHGRGFNPRTLQVILEMLKKDVIFPDVYLHEYLGRTALTMLLDRHPRRLQYEGNDNVTELCKLHLQHLTHLVLRDAYLSNKNIAGALSQAVENGRLSSLSHLSLQHCRSFFGEDLFPSPWPKLVSLNLYRVRFGIYSFEDLIQVLARGDLLPKLTSLVLSIYEPYMITLFFKQKFALLSGVFLDFIDVRIGQITQNNLPHLSRLGISAKLLEGHIPSLNLTSLLLHGLNTELTGLLNGMANNKATLSHIELNESRYLKGNLNVLLSNKFPSLNTLILKSNNLFSADLRSLVAALTDGKLPKLKKMDLSYNRMSPKLFKKLFCSQRKWDQLQILYIYDTFISSEKDIIDDVLLPENFPLLRKLGVTNIMEQKYGKTWPKLVTLGVSKHSLVNIAMAVDKGLLPNLCKLHIHDETIRKVFRNPAVIRLLKAVVAVCKRDKFEWPWPTEEIVSEK